MALSNRAPDWDWWRHVPTVTLHEAVTLSLNIDPKQFRRASARASTAGRQLDEGAEFERRLALAKRCLGDTLPGPVNHLAVRYYDEAAAVRLGDFAAWAHSVEWQIPPQLARLAAGREQSGTATADPDPSERLTLPEQVRLLAQTMPADRAKARIDKAFRLREIGYQPAYAVPYDGARIDWETWRVILPRLPRQPFTPTLAAAEFFHHFLPSRQASTESPQAARQPVEKAVAYSAEPQEGVPTEPILVKPEAEPGRVAGDANTHSGFPGRPSKGKHLIDDEFDRRVAAKQALPLVADEAEALLDWFKQQHPTMARPTPKTIQENIRARHRQWRANQPKPEPK
jgi:hypothetical protein